MKREALSLVLLLAAGMPRAQASFSNGDFSDGLNAWTVGGDVTAVGGAASLGDSAAAHSTLYQPVAWPAASFTLEFDFQGKLSPDSPQGSFPDVFFASIYFTSSPATFDPDNNGFDATVGLFDLDAPNGIYNVNASAAIGASPLGLDWSHCSVTLANPSDYIIPYFEVFDQNFAGADSSVLIDNVQLVPEPATLELAAAGMLALLFRAWRRRGRADAHG